MRTITLILAAFAMLWAGCQSEKAPQPPTTLMLAGQITNPAADYIVFFAGETPDTLMLDAEGRFHGEIALSEARRLNMRHGAESTAMYGIPGDSLYITLDTEQFDETVTYSGKGSEASNFLAAKYLKDEQQGEAYSYRELHQLSPEQFRSYQDSIRTVMDAFLNEFDQQNPLPAAFKQEEKSAIVYNWASNLQSYPSTAAYYQGVDSVALSDGFMAGVRELSLNEASLLGVREYSSFVDARLNEVSRECMGPRDPDGPPAAFYLEKIHVCDSLLNDQQVKEHFLHGTITDVLSFYGTEDIQGVIDAFKALTTNEEHISEVEAEWADWKKLGAGNPAPTFAYETMDGALISLDQFRGKAVYVDVWATWCGPCKAEIPHLQELEEEMKDENVVFLSVSVDDSREDWVEMVTNDQLGGIQVITGTGWDAQITKDYKINGIPRFLLINPDGSIGSADAHRPSTGEKVREQIRAAITSSTEMAAAK